MNTIEHIKQYIASLSTSKQQEIQLLHERIQALMPKCQLWYNDGKNEEGKVVTNPSIGYGHYIITYANGSTRSFFQIGLSANTSGISVHIMGIDDRTYLPNTYAKQIGKAKVSGYCINFKTIHDIHLDILDQAIRDGLMYSGKKQ